MITNATMKPKLPKIHTTDCELLMRFRLFEDEDAFTTLVRRHSQIVYQVCRRILRHEQDTEDAFQTTFLILAKKANSLKKYNSLASWLYRVARNTAIAAAQHRSKNQTEYLQQEPPATYKETLEQIGNQELADALDVELCKLPEKLRNPLVLYYLEGKTRKQIARTLDCTVHAINSRIARGQRMLRSKLLRRGVSLGLAMGVINASTVHAQSISLAPLIQSTVGQCSTATMAGGLTFGANLADLLTLAERGIRTMLAYTWTKPLAITTTLFLICASVFYWGQHCRVI